MKYLSNYIEEAQTKVFSDNGAFFAFSNEQFNKAKVEGVKYTSVGSGLICPSENVKALLDLLDSIHEQGIKTDIAENGIKAIIHRELANHEAQITYDIEDTVSALEGYDITEEQIQSEFKDYYKLCQQNDWF